MAPQLKYAKTSDDVDIAYWQLGEGPVIVQAPLVPFSHIAMEWELPEIRRWYERLARGATLVRYDGRGTGHSQREVPDRSLDAHVRDLDAVVGAVGAERVTIMGVFHSGPAAIVYTARHPDRVSDLVLWCTYAKGSKYWSAVRAEGLRALRQTDYVMFLQTAAHELIGWPEAEQASRFAELMEEAVEPDEADRQIAATRDFDVEDSLADIRVPTLVLHRRQLRWMDVSLSRELAAGIPGAGLTVVEGPSPHPAVGDVEAAAGAIDEFLGRDPSPMPTARSGGGLRTVIFTDLVGHTEIMSRLGDERGRRLLREHERLTRDALHDHGGREVKTLGDGFLGSFDSVSDAVECALAIQKRFEAWNASPVAAELATMSVRVGLNAGEPIDEDGDLFGSTVILASRIAAEAGGGEILVANSIRELCLGKGFDFSDRGLLEPRGFSEPVRVWEVEWTKSRN